jgi:hypothetical protein
MKTLTKLALTLIAVAGLQACDPYDDENKGPPSVIGTIGVFNGDTPFIGTAAGSTWSVVVPTKSVLFVKTNKLVNGDTIETAPPAPDGSGEDCTPFGNWLQVNGAPSVGWMSCYYPGSPSSAEGASVVLYAGPSPTRTSGYYDASTLAAGVYVLGGSVYDRQGHALTIDVNAFVAQASPKPDSDTQITVTFSDTGTNLTGVTLWKADDAGGAPGTWEQVATTSPFVDTGLTAETTYWYQVRGSSDTYPTGTPLTFETEPVSD